MHVLKINILLKPVYLNDCDTFLLTIGNYIYHIYIYMNWKKTYLKLYLLFILLFIIELKNSFSLWNCFSYNYWLLCYHILFCLILLFVFVLFLSCFLQTTSNFLWYLWNKLRIIYLIDIIHFFTMKTLTPSILTGKIYICLSLQSFCVLNW